ncbi:hypothetical protein SHIRM173S_06427 [Streptomyces hirsutus]
MAHGRFVPMTPVGPRLIQPATYSPGATAPSRSTRPARCGTVPPEASNGRPLQRHSAVPHRTQHQLRLDVLVRSRARHATVPVRHRPLEAHRAHAAVPGEQFDRAEEETQPDPPPGTRCGGLGPATQHLHVAALRGGQPGGIGVGRILRQLGPVHGDPGVRQDAQLAQFLGGEAGLGRTAPATMAMSVTRLTPSAVRAACGTSVGLSSGTPRASIRVTSTATFPTPMTTADLTPRRNPSSVGVPPCPGESAGWALYQDHRTSGQPTAPARSSPGMPRPVRCEGGWSSGP